jgi:hypothetical protein
MGEIKLRGDWDGSGMLWRDLFTMAARVNEVGWTVYEPGAEMMIAGGPETGDAGMALAALDAAGIPYDLADGGER